jgi:SAM-dependent methyltransferase
VCYGITPLTGCILSALPLEDKDWNRDTFVESSWQETRNMNIDRRTVESFGQEWTRFDQSALSVLEREELFQKYFGIFPWHSLPPNAQGFDLGCGSGRWAALVAPRVGQLHCIDASEAALSIAQKTLGSETNCVFHHAGVDAIPLPDSSMDFGYSLGVLHHVPDTQAGIRSCVAKLKVGAPFLIYLYYALDNKPWWFRAAWKATDAARKRIADLPERQKEFVCDVTAAGIYWPLARASKVMEQVGLDVGNMPLSAYRTSSFYTMRTDARDRFGTRLEQRFTRVEIEMMMISAGLTDIRFRDDVPYWCAVGTKSA